MVDRFSLDGTAEIGIKGGAKVIQADANRSIARNIGLEHSSSEGVLFVDSDMLISSRVLEDCIVGLEEHEALVIPEVSVGHGFWATCKAIERKTSQGDTLIEAPRCFLRSALISLGGYNPSLEAGEDWDLNIRAKRGNLAVGRVKSTILHDYGNSVLITTLQKKYNYGKSMQRYFKSHTRTTIKQLNPVRRILLPGFKGVRSDPIHGFGLIFLKTAEFTVAGAGSLTVVLKRSHQSPRSNL